MATKIAVVYSSKHGHTRGIAERLAATGATRGVECTLFDVRTASRRSLSRFDAVIVAGPVHFGRHARTLRDFVRQAAGQLAAVPSAFVSVSGSAASLEGRAEAERYIDDFLRATGWQPDLRLSAAGAILFTRYNPLLRLVMKFVARTAGHGTDTTRDYVYTNWAELDELMHQFVDTLERHARAALHSTA